MLIDSDEILRHAEKKQQTPNPNAPAATAPAPTPAPASTGYRSNAPPAQRPVAGSSRGPSSAGIASTAGSTRHPASNLGATYRNNPPPNARGGMPPQGGSRSLPGQQPSTGGFDPRGMRGAPPPQGHPQGQPPVRNGYPAAGRRF